MASSIMMAIRMRRALAILNTLPLYIACQECRQYGAYNPQADIQQQRVPLELHAQPAFQRRLDKIKEARRANDSAVYPAKSGKSENLGSGKSKQD
ncbi:hypothetical protein MY11210_004358 [Beauveria gryllotalpidicola]